MIRFLIAIVFLTISIFAEGTGSYTLLDFQPEDFSRNTFFGSIKATDNTEAQYIRLSTYKSRMDKP
jgi:hypothetical protein